MTSKAMQDRLAMIKKFEATIEKQTEANFRYINVVYGLFYAGFFALWAGVISTKKTVDLITAMAGGAMLTSIAIFAGWSLYLMMVNKKSIMIMYEKIINLKNGDEDEYNILHQKQLNDVVKSQKHHTWTTVVAVFFASLGILLLLWQFISLKVIDV
jgi:ribonucleotide reductase beta subunit family protein with ferritin-like domain